MYEKIDELNNAPNSSTNVNSVKLKCDAKLAIDDGVNLVLSGTSLPWGTWVEKPPHQISGPYIGSVFRACGAVGTASGTQGDVTFVTDDNSTYFTLAFDVPYSEPNSVVITCTGKNCD